MKKIYFTLLSLSCIFQSFGQEYYFKHFKTDNGLSHNTVNSILQDQFGFMWFGTKDGLNRFDGYSFKVFKHIPENLNSLGSNYIECLHEFDNKLWVGTDNGLYFFDNRTEIFKSIPLSLNHPILDIESDNNSLLWFVAGRSLFTYNVSTKQIANFGKDELNISELAKSPDGTIWAASSTKIFQYVLENNSFKTFDVFTNSKNSVPFIITKIYPLNNNEILIGTKNNGAILFDKEKNTFEKLLNESDEGIFVRDFIKKGDDELLIATESGLFIYDFKSEVSVNLKKKYSNRYSLSDNALYALAIDNENGLWIGSYFGGINYFSKQYTPFTKYFQKPDENSLTGNAVREDQTR